MSPNELYETVRRVADETGLKGQWKRLSDELNFQAIRTLKGAEWTPVNLRAFMTRHVTQSETAVPQTDQRNTVIQYHTEAAEPELVAQSTTGLTSPLSDAAPQCSTTDSEELDVPQSTTVTQISPEMLQELGEMLQWWRDQRGSRMTTGIAVEERPAFKRGDTDTKTVRLSRAMIRDAERFAHKHRAQTGGTFSGLVELLVWQALGQPEKFVAQEPTESDSQTAQHHVTQQIG